MKYSKKLSKALIVRRVVGDSMTPTLRQGQIIVASSLIKPANESVVVAKLKNDREVIKRLTIDSDSDSYVLSGDNSALSTNYIDDDVREITGCLLWPRL